MDIKLAFGKALQLVRKKKGLSQEDFNDNASRTYISTLERGIKSPTLEKVDQICGSLNVHPATLLIVMYSNLNQSKPHHLLAQIEAELQSFGIVE